MKSRMWMNLVMAVLVAGLFLTVSCSQKTVLPDETTVQDKSGMDGAGSQGGANGNGMSQRNLNDKMTKEEMMAMAKKAFVNDDVLFAYDSSDLDSTAKMLLKEKAAWLKANPRAYVTIEGHCDERGTTQYNLALGERRATVVKEYLMNLGISKNQLGTISWGEEKPKDKSSTESAYRLNRRAHFKIN